MYAAASRASGTAVDGIRSIPKNIISVKSRMRFVSAS
jgi:hypothetical protein